MAKKKKKKKQNETGMDRLKQIALWQWGLIVIGAGVLSNVVMGFVPPAGNSAAARGQAFGRGLGTLLFIILGIVLIIVHFVRARKR